MKVFIDLTGFGLSFEKHLKTLVIFGCSGAIGYAFVKLLSEKYPEAQIHGFSRSKPQQACPGVLYHVIDYADESAIEKAALQISQDAPIDVVIVANGMLHNGEITPEKSLKDLSAKKFRFLFEVNTILPALIAKHFLPRLNSEHKAIFAALSARSGSISDNELGGWYAYRASKAALNMLIKNAAIEIGRRNKQALIVALHPGTVDSSLSKPFQSYVPEGMLFTADYAVAKLWDVLENLQPEQSGRFFAWDGEEISP